jgi:hypothetical protein
MRLLLAASAGLLAGLVGAAVWAAISYYANFEIGWIAWGIGGLVGVVMFATSQEGSPALGGFAVLITVLSIAGGKYAASTMSADKYLKDLPTEYTDSYLDAHVTIGIAKTIANERIEAGQTLDWPRDATVESADQAEDFPADIWQEANATYQAFAPEKRAEYRQTRRGELLNFREALRSEIIEDGFKQSFGFLDVIFFGLAIFTAFKIASGSSE